MNINEGCCPSRRSFRCVLLLNQIFRKQCTVRQYTILIYLLNLLWKLGLGLGLDSELHYFSILRRVRKMSTLSSADVTDVNLVLKERTHKIKIKYSMQQYSNSYAYFRQLAHNSGHVVHTRACITTHYNLVQVKWQWRFADKKITSRSTAESKSSILLGLWQLWVECL